jgi:hypothetical protein
MKLKNLFTIGALAAAGGASLIASAGSDRASRLGKQPAWQWQWHESRRR